MNIKTCKIFIINLENNLEILDFDINDFFNLILLSI